MYGINLCLDCIYTIIKNGKSHFNRSDRITRIVWICRTYTCSPSLSTTLSTTPLIS